jgi:putative heme-binding domain-containing protein
MGQRRLLAGEENEMGRAEISKQEVSPVSMMPEGLLQALTAEQVRDLIAYLKHPTQVLPPHRAPQSCHGAGCRSA